MMLRLRWFMKLIQVCISEVSVVSCTAHSYMYVHVYIWLIKHKNKLEFRITHICVACSTSLWLWWSKHTYHQSVSTYTHSLTPRAVLKSTWLTRYCWHLLWCKSRFWLRTIICKALNIFLIIIINYACICCCNQICNLAVHACTG